MTPATTTCNSNLGSDSEAVRFASKDAAMIIRMRGLPFQTTEQQVKDFFADPKEDTGIVEPGGIMFVNRPDGRPSGDAFVLFANEAAGRRALMKHKQRIGTRYIELFRTTQAEVQQLFNRALKSPQVFSSALCAPKRDCIRLRGLPYEAQVQQVVDFLGVHSRNIVFQGVHMIYNNQGHPSGEAFIQMDSESSAASAAQSMHNKYMEVGKKKRYIEVFQCSAEDMNLLLSTPLLAQGSPQATQTTPPVFPQNLLPAGLMPGTTLIPMGTTQAGPFRPPTISLFGAPQATANGHAAMGQQNLALNLAAVAAMVNSAGANGFGLPFPTPPPMANGCEQAQFFSPFQQIPFFPADMTNPALLQHAANAHTTSGVDPATAFLIHQNMAAAGRFMGPPPNQTTQGVLNGLQNGTGMDFSNAHHLMDLSGQQRQQVVHGQTAQPHHFSLVHS
ncbi:RNA-binding protein sym-2 [Ditylenchus destructor]|nr:RNA-binding protein sym-2 [Ditylenchus destructor]